MIEETGTAPANADVAPATTQAPETQATPTQETAPQADAAAKPAATPERKPDPRQRKIAELSYELREQRRQMDRLLGIVEKQATAPRSQQADEPPRIENFSNIDEYLDAKIEYRDRQKSAKTQPESRQEYGNDHSAVVNAAREELLMSGAEKYDDFEETVFSPNVHISMPMADALLDIDDAGTRAEVAYYLAKNPKEALQITRLSPLRQVKEIDRLERKLGEKAEAPKKPSSAPEPIKPVAGNSTPSDELAPEMSFEKFLKIRNKQLGRK